jgi:EpsI family protein
MDAMIGKMTVPGVDIPLEYNRYVVARGNDKSVVMYWYQSATRTIASEYWAKIFLVLDSVRYNRSDTALVRVVYPLREDAASEVEAEVAGFVKTAFPVLRQALPH